MGLLRNAHTSAILATALILVLAVVVTAKTPETAVSIIPHHSPPRATVIWFDDVEGGTNGWTTTDHTAGATPHFHVSTYMVNHGTYHYWCGTFDYDTDGGYGNAWDDRLELPLTDVTGAYYPVLTFVYRFDSEAGYDFTYVQAESLGVWKNLNAGYNGTSPGWQDLGTYGFILDTYDNPVVARFRFLSDGAWSDEDGNYSSVAGAFMVDNILIFDFYGGAQYVFDDVEDGTGLCIPSVPGAAGNYWHIIDRMCPAYSDPHSWWCGDDADTGLIPNNIDNSLVTPMISLYALTGSSSCTLHYAMHMEIPTHAGDGINEYISTDGTTWYQTGAWWGDFEQCDGWASSGLDGIDVSSYLPASNLWYRFRMQTDDDGCGPGTAGGAGVMIDDVWVEATDTAVEETSWGSIKAFYR